MNILLTGSSGYIGGKLAPLLRSAGHHVTGLDRVENTSIELDDFLCIDLNELNEHASILSDIDMVMHLAAAKGDWGISADEFYLDNLSATEKLVSLGKEAGIKKWFFYSTVAVLGSSNEFIKEDSAFSPEIPYGASKADCEKLFTTLHQSDSQQEIIMLRPSAVFGIDNPPSTNIFRLIDAIQNHRMIMIGKGEVLKTTSYIENLLASTMFLLERMTTGLQVFHYVDDPVQSTGQLVSAVYDGLGKRQPRWYLPLSIAYPLAKIFDLISDISGKDLPITAARIKKFCTPTVFDSSEIRNLGFVQPVDTSEAIKITIDWHVGRS